MKILSFMACEDVRREADNKQTIVGFFEALSIKREAFVAGPVVIRLAGLLEANQMISKQAKTLHPNRPHHWWWTETVTTLRVA